MNQINEGTALSGAKPKTDQVHTMNKRLANIVDLFSACAVAGGDGRYATFFGDEERAERIVASDEMELPGEEYLEGIDLSIRDNVLLEIRRAYAGGFSAGEMQVASTVLDWLTLRDEPIFKAYMRGMIGEGNGIDTRGFEDEFFLAEDIAAIILCLPPPSEQEQDVGL